jgi:hypothetical protein
LGNRGHSTSSKHTEAVSFPLLLHYTYTELLAISYYFKADAIHFGLTHACTCSLPSFTTRPESSFCNRKTLSYIFRLNYTYLLCNHLWTYTCSAALLLSTIIHNSPRIFFLCSSNRKTQSVSKLYLSTELYVLALQPSLDLHMLSCTVAFYHHSQLAPNLLFVL